MADNGGCRLVVAAAGYGKTTALRRWYRDRVGWHPGRDAQEVLLEAAGSGRAPHQLVLDDVPRLDPDAERALWDAIAKLPATVTVALSSRWPLRPPADPAGLGDRAPVVRVRPADLTLTPERVAELLATEYDLRDPALAERLREATGGWPALVRLAAEVIASDGVPGALVAALAEPGGAVAEYVTDRILGPLPAAARRLIREVGELAPVTAALCAALGHRRAAEAVRLLGPTGILAADADALHSGGHGPGGRIVPLIAAVARHGGPPVPATVLATAARWYERHGPPRAAARAYRLAGDAEQVARVLTAHGARMTVTGNPGAVADLIGWLPERLRTRGLRLLLGDALRTAGDVAAAAHAYQMVAATETTTETTTENEAGWDAGLVWRMGLIHYLRGDQRAAMAQFARATRPGEPADEALLLAWRAVAVARLGDAVGGARLAWRGFHQAAEAGDDGALATAHTSLALCLGLTGDQVGSAEHYEAALRIADRAEDLVLLARILTNQSYHLIEQARYPQALAAAGRAAGCAAAAGHANLHALAIGNEANALLQLGRYDEAVERYERVLARYRRMGSRISAAALVGLGEVHRVRGCREQARTAFEEAVRLAGDHAGGGDSRELAVNALAGLARLALPDDPAAAGRHADEAARRATDDVRLPALIAQGWVAAVTGDRPAALRLADEAVRQARPAGQRAGLADALELRAAAEPDPARARSALREAHAIWTGAGAAGHAGRVLATLSRLPGATGEDRIAALLAAERTPGAGGEVDHDRAPAVVVRVLGRFEVRLAGRPVPPAVWQSRRARDLLRILVVRRGRPVPRTELCELLWPDDDAGRTGHRLSVLLSIVRGVLDPEKAFAADHYLVTDAASVALDVGRVWVDVTEFLTAVGHGRRLAEGGSLAEARTVLSAAERDYRGDVFEDEPYSDWAGPLREQARAAHLGALRTLASACRATGAPEAAVHHLLRLLEKDPYDEPAHRALVRTLATGGRHGEARRAFDRYRAAMREIGVRAPDAGLLAPRRPGPTGAAQP